MRAAFCSPRSLQDRCRVAAVHVLRNALERERGPWNPLCPPRNTETRAIGLSGGTCCIAAVARRGRSLPLGTPVTNIPPRPPIKLMLISLGKPGRAACRVCRRAARAEGGGHRGQGRGGGAARRPPRVRAGRAQAGRLSVAPRNWAKLANCAGSVNQAGGLVGGTGARRISACCRFKLQFLAPPRHGGAAVTQWSVSSRAGGPGGPPPRESLQVCLRAPSGRGVNHRQG